MAPTHVLLAVVVMAAWGFNFVVIKVGLVDLPPLMLSALRFTLAALPMAFFLKPPQAPWKWVVAFGVMLGIIKFSLLFVGMSIGVGAGLASLVLQLQAFFTILFAVLLLGEKLTLMRLMATTTAFSGIALLGLNAQGEAALAGLMMVIAAAAAWGAANIILKRCPGAKMLNLIVWASLVPPVPLFALSFLMEGGLKGAEGPLAAALLDVSWTGVGAVAYLAFVATVFGFAVWGRLLSLYPASQVAPFTLLVPIFGMASAAMVLGEPIGLIEGSAATLVLGGLLINVYGDRLLRPFRSHPAG